jgi:fido (protein-threonine AMPylation protein)
VGRTFYCTFHEYAARWDEIAATFSKEAVLKGSFDRYAVSDRKRGTATVDSEFLAEIEEWRALLAKNLALRNPRLSAHDLNFAVQRTIDRLIFLRICEDRGVEHYGSLQALLNGEHIYARLKFLYDQADDRYNSGLFHFKPEKDRAETPDTLTPKLKIDDKALKEIIGRLYAPKSPYEFSVFPIEILGQVYEQFLGKVIRLTAGHQAKIEEKPEVKKAGGVYYTPAYIVDYIVAHTVGALCEGPSAGPVLSLSKHSGQGKTPKQIAKLRILDPACGSGSFLIGAYTFLLDYHRDWYVNDGPEKHKKELFQAISPSPSGRGEGEGGAWRLTTQEKKRILLNNIYGVDIDSQAVEVTKLSLLLKVLEGESDDTLRRQLSFVHERALPDLGQNIKCGNSLIGPEYFTGQLLPDEDEMRRVNPFDWQREFPEIFPSTLVSTSTSPPAGGFDAVIGNPPYIRIQRIAHSESDYLFHSYESPTSKMDLSLVFLEKGLKLVKQAGRIGFICTSQWLTTGYGKNLRRMLSAGSLHEIVDFGSLPVFQAANTYPAIFVLSPTNAKNLSYKRITDVDQLNLVEIESATGRAIDFTKLSDAPWNLGGLDITDILRRLKLESKPLGEFGRAYIGCKTGMNEAFVVSKAQARELRLEKSVLLPYALRGEEISRYSKVEPGALVIYPYREGANGSPELIPEAQLKKECPHVHERLLSFKDRLRQRQDSRRLYAKGNDWYRHLRPGSFNYIRPKKLVFKAIARASCGGLLGENTAFDGANCPAIIPENLAGHSIKYLLGVLNSAFVSYYLRGVCPPKLSGYLKYSATCLSGTPVRVINFADMSDKAQHNRMIELVDSMLDLHHRLAEATHPDDRTRLQRQIDATDQEIDRLVYDLYGLTEEEIKIVEAASVASSSKVKDNDAHESETEPADRHRAGRHAAPTVAGTAQHAGEGGGGTPEGAAGAGEPVHGVREPTSQYGSSQNPPGDPEHPGELESTRTFETAEGRLSYSQLSERLAVPLVAIYDDLLQTAPAEIAITSEWLCLRHKRLAGHLYPDWAGRFRDLNVQVGAHIPPPFYEVPVHMRTFCDDLAERLTHNPGASVSSAAEFLAWADWRFQWIHPFRDFNGRIGRVLLAALLYKLSLPHVETAPADPAARREYLEALNGADDGNLGPLTDIWTRRIAETLCNQSRLAGWKCWR